MCPLCGSRTEVVDSRSDYKIANAIYRRRRCIKCDHKFTTYELPKSEYKKLFEVYISLEGMSRRFFGEQKGD